MVMRIDESKETASKAKEIKDKGFVRRLEEACERNPRCPTVGRGKQKWIYDLLEERFGTKVSAEAVRKWFAGESRPRPKIMSQLAQVLDVDEAWLSLGIMPDETPQEKRKRNAVADGAVNYIAGLIQMAGGNIAFPDRINDSNHTPDMFAIINGRQYVIEVKRVQRKDGSLKVRVPAKSVDNFLIGVIDTDSPAQFDIVRLAPDVVSKFGQHRGGYIELGIEKDGDSYVAGDRTLPRITEFSKLESAASEQSSAA